MSALPLEEEGEISSEVPTDSETTRQKGSFIMMIYASGKRRSAEYTVDACRELEPRGKGKPDTVDGEQWTGICTSGEHSLMGRSLPGSINQ